MPPKASPPTGKGGGIMKKKIGPIPVPIAIGLVAIVGFLAYRHFKNSTSSTVSTTAGQTGTDTSGTGQGGDLGSSGVGGGSGATGAGTAPDSSAQTGTDTGTNPASYYFFGTGSGLDNTAPPTSDTAPVAGGGNGGGSLPSGASPLASVGGGGNAAAPAMSAAQIATFGQYPSLNFTTPTPVTAGKVTAIPETHPGAVASATNPMGSYPTIQFGQPSSPKPPAQSFTSGVVNPTITANKTGGSANKKQGIYAVH